MDNDIKAILMRIRDNIRAVEQGQKEKQVLERIETDFQRMMELIKLFLISERDSYYGFILMNMTFRVAFHSNGIAGIVLNEFPPVFESNPLLLCKFSLKEILYIVCHEIDHVVLNHPAEMIRLGYNDPDLMIKFNLAADAAVNDRINDEIKKQGFKFCRQPDGLITSDVLAKMFQLRSVAHAENCIYYFELIKNKQTPDDALRGQPERMMEKADSSFGKNARDQENEAPSGKSPHESGDNVVTAQSCNSFRDHDWQADGEEEDVQAAARQLVNAAVEMMSDEARGLMPGSFISQVEVLNRPPKLTWQQILKRYVGTISAEKRKTHTRLNRRQPERFDLSGAVDDRVLKILVAIDTSASISDKMIVNIMIEIFGILAKRKHEITILECDSKVQRVYRITSPKDVKKKVAGRGGTAFTPAIQYINKDRYFRDALMIYFTDGYGEERIPKPRTYRNIWVVFDHVRNLSVREPYGIVIALER